MPGDYSMGGARSELERGIACGEEESLALLAAIGNATDGIDPAIACSADVSAARDVTYEIIGDLGRVATSLISATSSKIRDESFVELACSRASIAGNAFGRVSSHLSSAAIHGIGLSLQVGDLTGHAGTALSKASDALDIYRAVADDEEPVPAAAHHRKTVEDFTGQVLPPLTQAVDQAERDILEFDELCDNVQRAVGLLEVRCTELLQASSALPADQFTDRARKNANGAKAAISAVENLGKGMTASALSLSKLAASLTMVKGYLEDEVQTSLELTLQIARDKASRL